jgi:hypothetical protein
MNKSKLISATAIATVMSATAATAEMSVGGYASGYWSTSSASTGSALAKSSETLMVNYSGTMDNGMGIAMGISSYGESSDTSLYISSDMGSLGFGTTIHSAADAMDGMPAKAGLGLSGTDTVVSKDYSDGDDATGHGLKYTSPSMNGWTVAASTGFSDTQGVDATTSVAVSGSIAGVSLAAGIAMIDKADVAAVETAINGYYTVNTAPGTAIVISNNTGLAADVNSVAGAAALVAAGTHQLGQAYAPVVAAVEGSHDDTFITASYQLGDITLGYGMFASDDVASDKGDTATSVSVSMPFAGMTAGIQYGEADNNGANADDDGYRLGLVKSMGAGATFSVEYTDITTGVTTDDNPTQFRVGYSIGF